MGSLAIHYITILPGLTVNNWKLLSHRSLSAPVLKHSERVSSLIIAGSSLQSHCSKPQWSLIIFVLRWINIYGRASKAFLLQRSVGGSHRSQPCSARRRALCAWVGRGSHGVGRRLITGRIHWHRVGFNGSALHVGDQLVRDLSQYVFSQSGHAQHMVTCAVHVVSEWYKLLWHRKETHYFKTKPAMFSGFLAGTLKWWIKGAPRFENSL